MEKLPNKKTCKILVEVTDICHHLFIGLYKQSRFSSVAAGLVINLGGSQNKARIYEMPPLALVHCMPLHWILTMTLKDVIIIPVLQMRNLRLRKVKWPVQNTVISSDHYWDAKLGLLTPKSMVSSSPTLVKTASSSFF